MQAGMSPYHGEQVEVQGFILVFLDRLLAGDKYGDAHV